jgi:tetratricopeptide (TPR) repeat protein
MNAFMEEILTSADVDRGDAEINLVEVLERAAGRASGQFADHPDLEADVRELLGTSFLNLTRHIQALEHLERAYEVRRGRLGPAHPSTLGLGRRYAEALVATMPLDDAMVVVDDIARYLPEEEAMSRLALEARRLRGRILMHRREHEAAPRELYEVVRDARAALGPDDTTTLLAQGFLAKALLNRVQQGGTADAEADLAEAEALFRDAFERRRRVSGADARATRLDVFFGAHLAGHGRFAEAEPHIRAGIEGCDGFHGANWLAYVTRRELADLYEAWGQPDRAARWRAELERDDG